MQGLTENEVLVNRKKYGSNKIESEKNNTLIKLFLESLGDPIIKILLIALGIKIIFLFKDFDWYETIGIVIAILIASLVSAISEYGSEKAFLRLQEDSSKSKCKVKRNNVLSEVFIEEVVKNDIIYLSTGDKIPADGYLIKGSITVDESSLTGETKEIRKESVKEYLNKIADNNKVYRGTIVYSEDAIMLVTEVGDKTIYGNIAKELKSKEPDSPLKIRLRGLAKTISKMGYLGAILVSISYLFSVLVIKNNFDFSLIINDITNIKLVISYLLYALTLCVTVIVVAVPEGLPMMITLVLSTNMKKMVKENVLVRKLVGIETAGSLNVLLTDKTGTLTKGKLEVSSIIDAENKKYKNIIELSRNINYHNLIIKSMVINNASYFDVNNNAIGSNSTDRAILNYTGYHQFSNIKITNKIPFNSKNKYSLTVINDGKERCLIKGASERILPFCTHYYDYKGDKKPLLNKKSLMNNIAIETVKGIRVLVLAISDNYQGNLNNLIFLGMVLIKDEIRCEAKEGINLVTKAGIQTIMITGDAKETAVSIGKEVGLINSSKDIVLTSDELNKMTDEEIKINYYYIKIIARSLPSDKSRLVRIGQELDLVVGMTGDGINDAPALKKANVGFAMGSGTEVAKDASDIVILDDNIISISKAILYGRTIFKSIRKFIIFQLTVNICALIMSIIGPFIGIDTPITIIQMLWLNMIMDTFAGIAFSKEPALKEYMEEKPKKKNEKIINKYMVSEIIVTGCYGALLCILFLKAPFLRNLIRYQNEYFLTAYFALFIFIDIFNAFNARTERLNIFANILKNKLFIFIIVFIIIAQMYLIYFGGSVFRTYGLTVLELLLIIGIASSVIPIDFLRKKILKKMGIKKGV